MIADEFSRCAKCNKEVNTMALFACKGGGICGTCNNAYKDGRHDGYLAGLNKAMDIISDMGDEK